MTINEELKEIVHYSGLSNDKRHKPRVIKIECNEKLVFSMLKKLSEFFGTEEIDVNSENREGGYCETCSYSYSVNIIEITNPTKNIDIK